MLRNLSIIVVLAVCLIAIGTYRTRLLEASDTLSRMAPSAAHSVLRDRLLGTPIDLTRLLGAEPVATEQPMLALWILDVDKCQDCLSTAAAWDRIGTSETVHAIIGTVGHLTADDARRLDALSNADHRALNRDSVHGVLGTLPSSTKFLLEDQGTVILMDGRDDVKSCKWSFEGQVGTVLGLNTSRMIRGHYAIEQGASDASTDPDDLAR